MVEEWQERKKDEKLLLIGQEAYLFIYLRIYLGHSLINKPTAHPLIAAIAF
jgi:hypothetical protein